MALFSKKKKKPSRSGGGDDFEMFDIVGSDNENLSADQYPELSYEDMEGFNFPDDGDTNPGSKGGKKSSGGMQFRRMIIAGTILALLIIGAIYLTSGDGSGGGGSEGETQETTQSEEQGEGSGSSSDGEGSSGGNEGSGDTKNSGIVVTEQVGQEFSTSDDGNPINGTGAIMAFDYAYYTKRDGEAARKMFNPDADAYNADYIQRAIDKVPQGTTYSLGITPTRIGEEYKVKLTLNLPGAESPTVYNQVFLTEERNGQFFVKSFTSQTDSSQQ